MLQGLFRALGHLRIHWADEQEELDRAGKCFISTSADQDSIPMIFSHLNLLLKLERITILWQSWIQSLNRKRATVIGVNSIVFIFVCFLLLFLFVRFLCLQPGGRAFFPFVWCKDRADFHAPNHFSRILAQKSASARQIRDKQKRDCTKLSQSPPKTCFSITLNHELPFFVCDYKLNFLK